ncbi:MAG: ABC transporter permease [Oscillospiraceae bacterium]|jgi:ribose/xylose/arabinose/galactoside ABC-type transport system permease subunit|nr:ABC transporter permease [Oscillospiraceae bacterium]
MTKANKFLRSKHFSLLVLLVLELALFWALSRNHSFLKLNNIRNILNSMVIYTLLAVGGGLVIVAGEIDLSPGYVGTAAGAVMASLLANTGIPWFVVVIICLALGGAFGLLNAVLINELKLQSFIATLATGSFIAGGFAYIVVNGKTLEINNSALELIGTGKIGGFFPYMVIISLAVIIIYGVILAKTKFGRAVYLCGGNREAARLTGISPKAMSYILFANSGILGALAGILYDARLKAGNLTGTNHYVFPAITAAVLGGLSLGGGHGDMLGCFLGLLIISGFNNGLVILGVSPFWQNVASGLLLLLALTLDYFTKRRAKGGRARGKTSTVL